MADQQNHVANSSSMTESVGITPGGRIGIIPSEELPLINIAIGKSMMGIYSVKSVASGRNLNVWWLAHSQSYSLA